MALSVPVVPARRLVVSLGKALMKKVSSALRENCYPLTHPPMGKLRQ